MDEKQALAYASNILRTLNAMDPSPDNEHLLLSARALDRYAQNYDELAQWHAREGGVH